MITTNLAYSEWDKVFINPITTAAAVAEESQLLALKAQLAALIVRVVKKRRLSQKELGHLWGVPQPRVSEVMTGKRAVISIDRLVEFLSALGVELSVRAKGSAGKRRAG